MSDATKYTNKLHGKNVLIIGGSSGIGLAAAEASVESGASVVISSSKQARVDAAVQSIQKLYPSAEDRIRGYAYSMGDGDTLESNIISLLNDASSSGKTKLDHMIWTAGDALALTPLAEMDLTKLQQSGMVRFFGPVLMAKHAPKYLNPGPESSIILTTGSVSERPIPGWAAVGSYATALHGLNRGLALDLKPIRCNLISPGAVETSLWDGMNEEQKKATFKSFEEKSATGKLAQPEHLAEAYLYLMKDANITGSVISSSSGALLL